MRHLCRIFSKLLKAIGNCIFYCMFILKISLIAVRCQQKSSRNPTLKKLQNLDQRKFLKKSAFVQKLNFFFIFFGNKNMGGRLLFILVALTFCILFNHLYISTYISRKRKLVGLSAFHLNLHIEGDQIKDSL